MDDLGAALRALTPPPPAASAMNPAPPPSTLTLDKLVSWALTFMMTVVLAIVAYWASELQEQVHHLSSAIGSISDRTTRLEVKLDATGDKMDDLKKEWTRTRDLFEVDKRRK